MNGQPGGDGFELEMPFVTVASTGGPHHDESYVAGWEMGALAAELEHRRPSLVERVIHADNIRQADLVGMKYGYRVEVGEEDVGWAPLRLTLLEVAS